MNGATAEPSASTINTDSKIKKIRIGNSQYRLRYRINRQSSAKTDSRRSMRFCLFIHTIYIKNIVGINPVGRSRAKRRARFPAGKIGKY